MNRRLFGAGLVCSLSSLLAAQAPTVVYASREEGEFVACFNDWAKQGNRNGNIVDVKEIRLWQITEQAWNKLRRIVRQSYK